MKPEFVNMKPNGKVTAGKIGDIPEDDPSPISSILHLEVVPVIIGVIAYPMLFLVYFWSVREGHSERFLPYISWTGSFPPESCYFGSGLNVVALLGFFSLYVRNQELYYNTTWLGMQANYNLKVLLNFHFYLGALACIGLAGVGNFQVSNQRTVHYIVAVLFFICGEACLLCDILAMQHQKLIVQKPFKGIYKTRLALFIISACGAGLMFIMAITLFILKRVNPTAFEKYENPLNDACAGFEWLCALFMLAYFVSLYDSLKGLDFMAHVTRNKKIEQTVDEQ